MNFRQLFENQASMTDYDIWRDKVSTAGGEIHPQRDRVHLVAQSWDGDVIGEFNLKTNQGWFGQQGVAEGLNEFAPDGFNGGDDGEEFNPRMAKMAYEAGIVKGASLADGATLERAMAIDHWDSHDGGMYKQYFAKGFKQGRMNKIKHDNKQYNLNLKLMKDGSIRHGEQGVAEGKGDFAQAIENLHGWYEEESSNPNIRVWEFDDREGGYYAQGTVYYDVKTGRVKIKFEDRDGYHGGDVNDTFNSIGDAMNVLKNITVQIRPNTGKARDFDKLGGRTLAGPDDLYKTDREGRKGTLNKRRMGTMKASSPYRKTGPEGQLPESSVAEGIKSKAAAAALAGALATSPTQGAVVITPNIGAQYQNIKRDQEQKNQEKSKKAGQTFPLSDKSKDAMKEQGVAEGSDDGYGYKSLSTEQIMKLIKSGNWEAVQDVVPGKHIQLRNNRNGKSTTVHVKKDMAEGFDELDAYMKAKQAPQPSGGAGIKRGSYGMPGRKIAKGIQGLRPGGGSTGHTTPGNRDFGRPHSIPRAAPLGIDDYDANHRRDVDEGEYKDTVDKSKIPAVQRKAQGGDWKVSTRDLEHERSKSPTGPEGLAKAKQRLGMNENQQLPPEVIELLKKVAQSDAAPEHKKAIINAIMAKYQPIKDIAEEPKQTAREKFNKGLKRAGFDPDAAAKRLTDLIAKQKAERERFEKENPAVYGDTPDVKEEKVRLDPKCWKGKKIGSPKTKVKGGVRVNNCVPK